MDIRGKPAMVQLPHQEVAAQAVAELKVQVSRLEV
jgi:hypothetical protein